jgi:hypothetical protein
LTFDFAIADSFSSAAFSSSSVWPSRFFAFSFPEHFGEVRERAVGGDLVVLGLLRTCDQRRIEDGAFQLFHGVLPFLDDPHDAVAFLSTDGFANRPENLLESLHLSLGFAEMVRERRAQFLGFRRLRHARKRLGQPLFTVVHIAEFFDE